MGLVGLFAVAIAVWILGGVWFTLRLAGRPPGGAAASAMSAGAPIDLESAGLRGRVWVLQADAGIGLEVMDIEGHGAGPVLVLVHDWGDAALTLLPHAVDAAETHRRVLLPALRGHEGGGGRCSLGPAEVRDVRLLLETAGSPESVLEGWGLGGRVALDASDAEGVADVRDHGAWSGRRDGIRRILSSRGIPMWPVGWLASWLWPERGAVS
ncbi:MAG: alpha/beta hydrolase [Phycisphaerales bacterium]|jgi:pimeloyl-ACP methyl ester carboxylesterase|nr:alpha/beta hydrolase [Phycisphaerales bacterium]